MNILDCYPSQTIPPKIHHYWTSPPFGTDPLPALTAAMNRLAAAIERFNEHKERNK